MPPPPRARMLPAAAAASAAAAVPIVSLALSGLAAGSAEPRK